MLTVWQEFNITGYLVPSGLHWQFSWCVLFCFWTAGHMSSKVETCCRPSQLIWQVMTGLASNTVHCVLNSLLCSEYFLPCLGAASSSPAPHCMHIVVLPPGYPFFWSQTFCLPWTACNRHHSVCADFMHTTEIINSVIITALTLQASAHCSRPDSLLCANGSVLLLCNDIVPASVVSQLLVW